MQTRARNKPPAEDTAPMPPKSHHPHIDDPVEKRKYKFTNVQNPGAHVEFSKGRTVIGRNGQQRTVTESFCLEDGLEYEIPVDVAKHLNSKSYKEKDQVRPRVSLVEV